MSGSFLLGRSRRPMRRAAGPGLAPDSHSAFLQPISLLSDVEFTQYSKTSSN